MAIKEFVIGPQSYFEENYFSGDYTESNVSRSFLECDVDFIKGGRVITGEYYLDNYIDGTYYHNNSMAFGLTAEAMIVQVAEVSMEGYFNEGYYQLGYYGTSGGTFLLTAELEQVGQDVFAEASLASSASVEIQVGVIKSAESQMSAEFTQTVTISHIEGADLFAFSEAAIEVIVDRIRDNNISVSGQFSVTTDISRIRHISADDINAVSALTGDNLRVRYYEAAFDAAFSLNSISQATREFASSIESSSSLAVETTKVIEFNINAGSLFTPSVDAVAFINSFAVLDSVASLSATANNLGNLSADLNTTASISATVTKSVAYWHKEFDIPASPSVSVNGLLVDSAENIVAVGGYAGSTNALITKWDKLGTVLWTKTLTSADSETFYSVESDSSGNLYAAGTGTISGTQCGILVKYNSSGTLQWQRTLDSTISGGRASFLDHKVTASGDIYLAGDITTASGVKAAVVKYNSAGTLSWISYLNLSSSREIVIDTSGNSYVSSSSGNYAYLTKVSPSGGLVSSTRFLGSGANLISSDVTGLTIDTSNNIYFSYIHYNSVASETRNSISKLNTSLVTSWTKSYTVEIENNSITSADWSDNYLYITVGNNKSAQAQINPANGDVIWCKKYVSGSGYNYNLFPEVILVQGNTIYVGGNDYNYPPTLVKGTISKFAINGSGVPNSGTYTNYALTPVTYTITQTSGGITVTSTTGSSATGTLTDSTGTISIDYTAEFSGVGINKTLDATAISSAASLTAIGSRRQLVQASIASQVALVAQPDFGLKNATASLTSNGFVVAVVGRIIPETAGLESEFTFYANAGKQVNATATLESVSSLTATALDLDLAEISLTCSSELIVNAESNKPASSTLTSSSSLVLISNVNKPYTSNITSQANLSLLGGKVFTTSSSISSIASLYAKPQPYGLRPNGTWDGAIEMFNKYSQWNTISIDNIVVPSGSSTPTEIFDFGGRKITRQDNTVTIQGETRTVTAGTYNLSITRNSPIVFGGQTFGIWDFDPNVGTIYHPEGSYGTSWRWNGSTGNFNGLKLPYGSSISTKKVLATIYIENQDYNIVLNWTWTWTTTGTLRFFWERKNKSSGALTQLATISGVIVNNPLLWPDGYGIGKFANIGVSITSYPDFLLSGFQGIPAGLNIGLNSLDTVTAIEILGTDTHIPSGVTGAVTYLPISSPYIVAPTGSNLLVTSTGYNPSVVVSTNPYLVRDQTYILGLYNSYGSTDNTGILKQTTASMASVSLLASTPGKLAKANATLSSAVSQTTRLVKTARAQSNLTSIVTLTASVQKVKNNQANLQATSTISVTVKKTARISSSITSTASIVASPYDFTKYSAQLSVTASQTTSVLRTKQLSAGLVVAGSELVAINKIGQGLIGLDVPVTMTVTGQVTSDQPQYMFAQTGLVAQGVNTQFGQAQLQSNSTFSLTATYLRRNEAQLTSSFTQATNNTRRRSTPVSTGSSFNQFTYTANSKILTTPAALSSATNFSIQNQIVRLAQAQLSSQATQNTIAGSVTRFEIHMEAFDSVLVAGRVLHIDEYLQLQIERESRGLIITQETRLLGVDSETRVNKIIGR